VKETPDLNTDNFHGVCLYMLQHGIDHIEILHTSQHVLGEQQRRTQHRFGIYADNGREEAGCIIREDYGSIT